MGIGVVCGSRTSSSPVMDRRRGGRWTTEAPLVQSDTSLPLGAVSSLPPLSPMLLSVLVWLFYPESCLRHQATFLHMHRLNFWPGGSAQRCIRETVVLSGEVGPPVPTVTRSCLLQLRGLTPETSPAAKAFSSTMLADTQSGWLDGAVCEPSSHFDISVLYRFHSCRQT